MQQAVLHQAVAANPVRDLERIESAKGHKKAPQRGSRPRNADACLSTSTPTRRPSAPTCPTSSGSLSAPGCASVRSARCAGWTSTSTASRSSARPTCASSPSSRSAERLSSQGQGPRRARRQDVDGTADRAAAAVRRDTTPRRHQADDAAPATPKGDALRALLLADHRRIGHLDRALWTMFPTGIASTVNTVRCEEQFRGVPPVGHPDPCPAARGPRLHAELPQTPCCPWLHTGAGAC